MRLARPPMEITIFGGLADLPHFNPDLDGDRPPDAVAVLRNAIGNAQGLLISSPEYARGVAGVLKNALDWLVSSTEFPGKPVALINASQRATHADAALRLTLNTMSANLVEVASIMLPLLGRNLDAAGIMADADLSSELSQALHNLGRAITTAS
jgi:chromate reductase